MIGNGPHSGFRVSGLRVEEIRFAADRVRAILEIGDAPQNVKIYRLLDLLSVKYGITFDVLDPDEMPHLGVEGCWEPESMTMYFRSDVFKNACLGKHRPRFTVMHELGHALLGHRRTINRAADYPPPKHFEDSEWQANQFAAEFLMPLEVIRQLHLTSPEEISGHFNVSLQAAKNRVKQLARRGEMPC